MKTTSIHVQLRDPRVPDHVLAPFLAWLEALQKSDYFFSGEPWVPVGFIGGVLTLAHKHLETEFPIPPFAGQPVEISEHDYDRVLEDVKPRLNTAWNGARMHYSRPEEAAAEWPCFPDDAGYLAFIAEKMVCEKRVLAQMEQWQNLPPEKWTDGMRETWRFLSQRVPVVDIRYLKTAIPPEFQEILASSNAISIVTDEDRRVVIALPASAHIRQFEDKFLQRAGFDRKIIYTVSREDWLRDFVQESGRSTKETAHKSASGSRAVRDEKSDLEIDVERSLKINPRKTGVEAAAIFEFLLASAYNKKSTDIHVESAIYSDGGGRVRIRVDGEGILLIEHMLEDTMGMLFRHIKDKCKMQEQTFLPQDGALAVRFNYEGSVRILKLRVSAMPVKEGKTQSIVLRFLNFMTANLEALDIAPRERKVLEWAIKRPHGVVYVTGPTGSGKTTTLYSCLAELNTPENVILTVEDPVEYELNGVRQTQVDPAKNFTFAEALRSMLRQDPDIILVGETRDAETAQMLLSAAETGHLCFTTLHTNSALAVLSRMDTFSMQSRSFDRQKIISSSILFHAQRLVKKVCPSCYETAPLSDWERKIFEGESVAAPARVRKGKGCSLCQGRGTTGRLAIMEMVPVEEGGEIYNAIESGKTVQQLRQLATKLGCRTLFQSALERVAENLIPLTEAMLHNTRLYNE